MFTVYQVPHSILNETFVHFRHCGDGKRECQALWTSPWSAPEKITNVAHPQHKASFAGFDLNTKWLHEFWQSLAIKKLGVRIQVHTHPGEAFHSETDDAFPIIHAAGFLSLVIPDFAQGPIGFKHAFLAELQADGQWNEVSISERLILI